MSTFDPADLYDIPGTTVFTTAHSLRALHLHRFCRSLMDPAARETFKADERAYLERFPMTEEQRDAVLQRDYNRLIGTGGNIFFLLKIAATDGWSAQQCASAMSGMTTEDYAAMMLAGGRSPEGLRSIKGGN